MTKLLMYLYIVLLFTAIFPTHYVHALSCASTTLEQEARASSAIFMGTAEKVTDGGTTAEIKVEKSWKGVDVGKIVRVVSEDSAGWGLKFKNGRKYIIFARGRSPYTIDVCQLSGLFHIKCDKRI